MYSKTIVVGHLGRDPELRYTSSGQAVSSFSVATTRRWTSQDGTQQERTTWFRVTAWGKLGELCHQYLAKGRLVLVEGDIDASAWRSSDGEPRASLELTARNVRFLGGRDMVGPVPAMTGVGGHMDAEPPMIEEEEIPF